MEGLGDSNDQTKPDTINVHLHPSVQRTTAQQQVWTTGLLDCTEDMDSAVVTFLCPCVTFGQITEILDEDEDSCCVCGMCYVLVTYIGFHPWILSCWYRTKLRQKYGLEQSPAGDWIIHLFCEVCALCQEYRELKNRGLDPWIGWEEHKKRIEQQQQQQQQRAATYPPPRQAMAA